MNLLTRRSLVLGGLGLLGTGALAACASPAQTPAPAEASSPGTAITHVHAITRDTVTGGGAGAGTILLATHEGLFHLQDGELTQMGPVVDLMGFTVTPEGRYLASGHPGPGTDLPEPVGLIESTDQGQTWQVLSRGGESDFHALAAGPNGVIATPTVGFPRQVTWHYVDQARADTLGDTLWSLQNELATPAGINATPVDRLTQRTQEEMATTPVLRSP